MSDDLAVDGNHGRAIKVQATAIAALLVGIEVHSADLASRHSSSRAAPDDGGCLVTTVPSIHARLALVPNQIDAFVEFAEFVMRSRAVGEDLDAIEAQMDVRAVGREELLALLGRQARVQGRHHGIAERHRLLACHLAHARRQRILLDLSQFLVHQDCG